MASRGPDAVLDNLDEQERLENPMMVQNSYRVSFASATASTKLLHRGLGKPTHACLRLTRLFSVKSVIPEGARESKYLPGSGKAIRKSQTPLAAEVAQSVRDRAGQATELTGRLPLGPTRLPRLSRADPGLEAAAERFARIVPCPVLQERDSDHRFA